jgi:hypothetical protein
VFGVDAFDSRPIIVDGAPVSHPHAARRHP